MTGRDRRGRRKTSKRDRAARTVPTAPAWEDAWVGTRIFRIVVRGHFHGLDAEQRANLRAAEIALDRARASLTAMGVDHRHLRATATNMASVWD